MGRTRLQPDDSDETTNNVNNQIIESLTQTSDESRSTNALLVENILELRKMVEHLQFVTDEEVIDIPLEKN